MNILFGLPCHTVYTKNSLIGDLLPNKGHAQIIWNKELKLRIFSALLMAIFLSYILYIGALAVALSGLIIFIVSTVELYCMTRKNIDTQKYFILGFILLSMLCASWIYLGYKSINYIIWLITVVVSADVGAFFTGRAFGGRKLAPKISPGKTWTGTIGGYFLSIICGVFIYYAFYSRSALPNIGGPSRLIFIIVIITALSQIGDLTESYLKRRCGVKDSGFIIPGHGGILDRMDSFFLSSPFLALTVIFL